MGAPLAVAAWKVTVCLRMHICALQERESGGLAGKSQKQPFSHLNPKSM